MSAARNSSLVVNAHEKFAKQVISRRNLPSCSLESVASDDNALRLLIYTHLYSFLVVWNALFTIWILPENFSELEVYLR